MCSLTWRQVATIGTIDIYAWGIYRVGYYRNTNIQVLGYIMEVQ